MTWVDKLRNWDYDLGVVFNWFTDIVGFHVERIGWPAYIGVAVVIIIAGLAFPPSRGLTSLIISGTFRAVFTYLQIVLSLITVQLVAFLGKLLLAQFHRARRWISSLASKMTNK